ncbi:MAG: NUDIX hydrolase [Clostridia bacterium]|nr:NUDIX hydrolase [Clostridia bacterium]
MNYKILNEYNLTEDEMDGVVVRVKAFVINSKNEIMLASSNGGVQLLGGHVEIGEEPVDTLKREMMEEAGIEIANHEISEPFYEVKHYTKNYFHSSKNIIAKIVYYIVRTDKVPNRNRVKLTKQEQNYDFHIQWIPFESFEKYVEGFLNSEKEVNRWIASEMLSAFCEVKSISSMS